MSNTITTEQMKQALNQAHGLPANANAEVGELSVADLVADSAEFVVAVATNVGVAVANNVVNAGTNTVSFVDRVKTRFQFQRAVRKGSIVLPAAKPDTLVRKITKKAS